MWSPAAVSGGWFNPTGDQKNSGGWFKAVIRRVIKKM